MVKVKSQPRIYDLIDNMLKDPRMPEVLEELVEMRDGADAEADKDEKFVKSMVVGTSFIAALSGGNRSFRISVAVADEDGNFGDEEDE